MNPDIFLFRTLNGFVGNVLGVDALTRVVVNDFVTLTLGGITLVALWFSGGKREQHAIVFTLIGFALTLAVVKFFWMIYFRARPFTDMEVNLLFYRPSVSSFPSLPIAMAFCFAEGARRANQRAGIILYALGALYALARVYAGVHYPSDVAGGALIGAGMVGVVARLDFIATPIAERVIVLARRVGFT